MSLSVGIGLTNDCDLHCAHCYRDPDDIRYLSIEAVRDVCEHLPVTSVGLGTGENALHPDFCRIVADLHGRGIKLSMASNGYSLTTIPEEALRSFRDVEVSIDFASEREQDRFRGDGNWQLVHEAIDRCQSLNVEVSMLTTMMSINYDQMDALAALAQSLAINMRFNVYQPMHTREFMLSYEQFWEGFRRVFGAARLRSCTEPVVRAVLGLHPVYSPCGHESIRVTPSGNLAPCVYWPSSPLTLADLDKQLDGILATEPFEQARWIPSAAADCACQGGCASRRALLGVLDAHDLYCPWVRNDPVSLDVTWAPHRELVRARNYCTTIVC